MDSELRCRVGVAVLLAAISAAWGAQADEATPLAGRQLPEAVRPRPGYPAAFRVWIEPDQAATGGRVQLHIRAELDPGWHVYSLTLHQAAAGPRATAITLSETGGLKPVGSPAAAPPPTVAHDPAFDMMVEYHEGVVTWSQRLAVPDELQPGTVTVVGTVFHQICSETSCLPPSEFKFKVPVAVVETAGAAAGLKPAEAAGAVPSPPAAVTSPAQIAGKGGPAVGAGAALAGASAGAAAGEATPVTGQAPALIAFLVAAVASGLVSVLTPCVFPMIPITVGFFLKQSETGQRSAVAMAAVYVATIVGIFTLLGATLGSTFVALGRSPWFNAAMACLLVALALTLFGVFELRVPGFLVRLTSSREGQGGLVGVVFMAATFVIMSTPCTGPFAGQVLVWSSQGQWSWPVIGLATYSLALASPFFLLALLPGMLRRLPKAGGWLNSVKVSMGFLVLASVLYFVVKADLGWGTRVVSRSLVLAVWAALGLTAALYLAGLVRLSGDSPVEAISVARLGWSVAFLAAGLYFCSGLFGRSLGSWVEAIVPADESLGVAAAAGGQRELRWMETTFAEALAEARRQNRPLFADFTGQFCVNCKQMEKAVFGQPGVVQRFGQMVLGKLYTDRGTPEDKINYQVQQERFGSVAAPFYAIVAPNGETLATLAGKKSAERFVQFLDEGLRRWRAGRASQRAGKPESPGPAGTPAGQQQTTASSPINGLADSRRQPPDKSAAEQGPQWLPFERKRIDQLLAQGRTVIVDWTANW